MSGFLPDKKVTNCSFSGDAAVQQRSVLAVCQRQYFTWNTTVRNISGHTSQKTHKVQEKYFVFLLEPCIADAHCTHTHTESRNEVYVFVCQHLWNAQSSYRVLWVWETDRGGLDEKQVQHVIKRHSAEREIVKIYECGLRETHLAIWALSLSLHSPAVEKEWNHYCYLSPISSQLVVTLSESRVVSSSATSHSELMCCHPGLTAAPNSLRPWMKSILQEPLKSVEVI